MAMQVTLEVGELDQLRQRAIRRRLQLAAVLAQLRLDVFQPQQGVHLGLGLAAMRLARGVVEDAVLGDVNPLSCRRVAQRHVVLLGAREVLEQVAELIRRDDLQIDLERGVCAQTHAGLGWRPV